MIVTLFRSSLKPDHVDEYYALASQMSALAKMMPGYVSHKTFTAEDGERVTVVEFDSQENHQIWADHPDHKAAQKRGIEAFYADYSIQICEVIRQSSFKA